MKVTCLTAVYKRHEITEIFYKAFAQQQQLAALQGIELSLCVVASTEQDAKLARRYWHEPIMADNRPLGAKHNAGLAHAMQYEFHYLMQLGSDDILCDSFFQLPTLHGALEGGLQVFGMNRLIFLDVSTWRAKHVQVLNPFGAGRFIRRDLLDRVVWCKLVRWNDSYSGKTFKVGKGQEQYVPVSKVNPKIHDVIDNTPVVKLWDDDKQAGLDYNSERRLISVLGMKEARCRQIDIQDAVIDLKGKENIHAYDKIQGEPLSAIEMQDLHKRFGIMGEVERLRMHTV
jgi:hypothetical protein